jgi:hypothetical protein
VIVYLVIDCRDYYSHPVVHAASTDEKAEAWAKEHFEGDPMWDLRGFEIDGDETDWSKPR